MITLATIFGATFLLAQMDPLINPTKFEVNVGWVVAALLAAILTLGRGKIAAWDKHLEECQSKNLTLAADDATNESRIKKLEQWTDEFRVTTHWLGDCMMSIGGSLNAKLPPRPEPSQTRRSYDTH